MEKAKSTKLTKRNPIKPEIKKIIRQLKNNRLSIREIPIEFASDINILRVERELGIRKTTLRGFDVINQDFFVEEELLSRDFEVLYSPKRTFKDFQEYYNYLEGDIYENACYYQYKFSDSFSKSMNLNLRKLKRRKCFISKNIDDYILEGSQEEVSVYENIENMKSEIKEAVEKFNNCKTCREITSFVRTYQSFPLPGVNLIFFFWQYVFNNIHDETKFNALMKYMSSGGYLENRIIQGLFLVYNPDDVLANYDYSVGVQQTICSHKRNLKKFVSSLKENKIEIDAEGYFDKSTHYFCEKMSMYQYIDCQGIRKRCYIDSVYHYFETFDEFVAYRNGDLRNCDLSGAIFLNVDFSNFIIDSKTTKLPPNKKMNLDYKIQKNYADGSFYVNQLWYDSNNNVIKKNSHRFDYFFDFLAFLKGDLSYANLLLCDGLKNIAKAKNINWENAQIPSNLCEKFNIAYVTCHYNKNLIQSFEGISKNEETTLQSLQTSREPFSYKDALTYESYIKGKHYFDTDQRIHYISDLHLMHKIKNFGCKSNDDIILVVKQIIVTLVRESGNLLLIGGDVSSDFTFFELFVKLLREEIDRYYDYHPTYEKMEVVFILGNHELWSFPELSVNEITQKYRDLLLTHNMHLLQNDLFYKNESNQIGIIPYAELISQSNDLLAEKLRCSRVVILGCLGFSGYNEEFNAKNGIYRNALDRENEILESKKTEELYNKLCTVLKGKNTVIFTHMPKENWCADSIYQPNFVYVNGHTHKNIFFDDGVTRLYADNQIGYKYDDPHLKSFILDGEYDYFFDYKDGIYEITRQEYNDFYRGKNISITFTRENGTIYMLKKQKYYCFIYKGQSGSYSIMNGGALRKLNIQSINYYFERMDSVILSLQTPLNKYSAFQISIAEQIKKFGGDGSIHGCIIDIDFFNHVYVNPIDLKVTGYWAKNIIKKVIYPSIPELLKDRAPNLYLKYQNMLENDPTISLTIYEPKEEMTLLPRNYLETDIYKVSRELKRMQKLDSNILTIWYDPVSNEYALTSENEDCHSGNGISNDNLIEKISTLQSK